MLAKNNVRARTANEMLRAFAHVRDYGHLLWLPIYCHHGTADKLASIAVSPLHLKHASTSSCSGFAATLEQVSLLFCYLNKLLQIPHGPQGAGRRLEEGADLP